MKRETLETTNKGCGDSCCCPQTSLGPTETGDRDRRQRQRTCTQRGPLKCPLRGPHAVSAANHLRSAAPGVCISSVSNRFSVSWFRDSSLHEREGRLWPEQETPPCWRGSLFRGDSCSLGASVSHCSFSGADQGCLQDKTPKAVGRHCSRDPFPESSVSS